MDILRDLSIDLSICHVDITQGLHSTAAGLQIALASSAHEEYRQLPNP